MCIMCVMHLTTALPSYVHITTYTVYKTDRLTDWEHEMSSIQR